MTIRRAHPIDPAALKELRTADDAGRRMRPVTDEEGGAPLRCCLRRSAPGERIALVSYAPLRRWAAGTGVDPGAYDEQGPVFIHAEECGGPDGDALPFANAHRTVRRYSADGRILGGRLVESGRSRRRSRRRSPTPRWRCCTSGPWSTGASCTRCAGPAERGRGAHR